MTICKNISLFILFLFAHTANAQVVASIKEMEDTYKECLRIKPDSNICSKTFLSQMDSMLNVVFNDVVKQNPSNMKSELLKDHFSWSKKKAEFFKIQDETFVFNLKDGIWTKDMIRISYQQKAEFLLKRIRVLLKKLP